VYRHDRGLYIHPLKVQHRYSPTMYMLHARSGQEFSPVADSTTIAQIMTSTKYIAIKSTVRYLFPIEGNIKPYAGAGLGIHLYSWDYDYPGYSYGGYTFPGGSFSDSDTEFGFHILGGAEFKLSPKWKLQTELEYGSADLDQFAIVANFIYALGK
jgi:opacity protein-like surface antigen